MKLKKMRNKFPYPDKRQHTAQIAKALLFAAILSVLEL